MYKVLLDPKVSIILVNYKTAKMTADAIDSVKEKTKDITYEVIVVDNSCDINEYNQLVKEINDPNIKIIDAKENLGFGKANNLGVTYAKGKYLFFLNTDTLLINDAISILANYLDNNSNVGVVGPNLYTKDKKPNHSYLFNEKNVKHDRKSDSLLNTIKNKFLNKRTDFNYTNNPLNIYGYICGASLMIRKDSFDKLNGFDQDIFMYAEESLLCYRLLHELKQEIYNIPIAKIIHFEGASIKGFTLYKAKSYINGNYIYYLKSFGKTEAINYLKIMLKSSKKKKNIARLIRNNNKYEKFNNLVIAIKLKLKEIGEIK